MRLAKEKPGESEYLDRVWQLKERIRRNDGYLRQTWDFFSRAYTQNQSYLCFDTEDNRIIAFATVRDDGYLLFLGVHPDYRGEGLGKKLIAEIENEFNTITCHTRTTNDNAIGFYEHLGFELEKRVDSYYRDGDPAYYLVKNVNESSLRERISDILTESED